MTRSGLVLLTAFALVVSLVAFACGGGGTSEKPGDRITDPARVPSSTPIQNATLYKIQGNEVLISGGATGQITPVAPATATSTEYTIKSGDFCSSIAAANKITVEELQKANRQMDCNNLRIGDKIKIPSAAAATPTRGALTGAATTKPGTSGGAKTYTVQPGDTCAAIATSQGVTLSAFLAANPKINADCSNLSPGAAVTIP
jgi:LysM repeat protein